VARRRKRPAHGYVVERPGRTGIAYAIWYRFNGKRIYRTVGRSEDGYTRDSAEVELQNVLADINRGHHQEVEEVTFERFASDWYHRREPEWAPKTARSYKDTLELHLSPYFGDYLLGQLALEHVDAYKAHKLREGRLSAYSINKSISLLSSVLEDAVRYRLIASNPARLVKRLKAARPEGHYLEPFQVAPLLDALPERHRTLFGLLIRAGLRIGEATALRWSDVDPHRAVIVLRRTISAGKVKESTKSGDTHAVVRLTPELVRSLAAWQLREHDAGRGGDGEWVFPSDGGRPLDPDNLRKRVLRPAVKAANGKLTEDELPGIPEGLTLHDLRRSCCSLLFASGAQLPEVMERMRHRDERMTLRVYAKVMRSRASDVDAALDALLTSNKPATNGAAKKPGQKKERPAGRP
jgi:integrase